MNGALERRRKLLRRSEAALGLQRWALQSVVLQLPWGFRGAALWRRGIHAIILLWVPDVRGVLRKRGLGMERAVEAIELARDRLCWRHPFLAPFVERLRPEAVDGARPFATDGRRILFGAQPAAADSEKMAADREAVRRQGESLSPDLQASASAVSACPSPQSTAADGADFSVERLERVILHMIAHCLLGHVWMEREGAAFDLACDVQAWLLAEELAPETALSGDAQELRRRLRGAETLAQTREILESDSFVREHREELSKRIALDAHDLWGRAAPEARAAWGEGLSRARRRGSGSFGAGAGGRRLEWSPARADAAELAGALARYSVMRENPREDADSFQTAWYLYGLEHFGNVPLIEPPEEREERRLEMLAVVIDTSGSCARGLTQRFLALLRGLMEQSGLFFRRFNLHVIQCDARVQRDDKIVDLRAFERYIDSLELYGGGGTDFRPAFEHIDALVASGELRGLKGALFFSDGRGIFPSVPPEYEATFVFLKHRFDAIDVPGWVRRLVVDAPPPAGGEYFEY